jgi:HSP20 family molecular chaperone IbpA
MVAITPAQAVDDTKTTTKYADGVLELVLPKKAAAATQKIAIE